eukprot:c23781_g1_i2 orf=848-2233(+)
MERKFSVDDILGTFWKMESHCEAYNGNFAIDSIEEIPADDVANVQPGKPMKRSYSEWALQEFLQKLSVIPFDEMHMKPSANGDGDQEGQVDTVPVKEQEETGRTKPFSNGGDIGRQRQFSHDLNPSLTGQTGGVSGVRQCDLPEGEHFVKQPPDLGIAAVDYLRYEGIIGTIESSVERPQGLRVEPHINGERDGINRPTWTGFSGPVDTLALSLMPKCGSAHQLVSRIAGTGSSWEHSDNEAEVVQNFTDKNMDVHDFRRYRRLSSNRESARRSRRRKQAHLDTLEMQVTQLRLENYSLFKQLTKITQKFDEAARDSHILKSDVEALRKKIKLAEEISAAAAGDSHIHICNFLVPLSSNECPHLRYLSGSCDLSSEVVSKESLSVLIQSCYNVPFCCIEQGTGSQQQRVGSKMGSSPSMQCVENLEHLQKRIRVPCGPLSWGKDCHMEISPVIVQGSNNDN